MRFHHFRRALHNIGYNGRATIWNLLTLSAAMLLVGASLLALINVHRLTELWNNVSQVILYLDDDLTASEQQRLEVLLRAYPEIASSRLIEPDTTIKEFIALGSEARQLVSGLDPAIFPPAVEITFSPQVKTENLPTILARLQSTPAVTMVDYGQTEHEEIGALAVIIRGIATVFLVVIVILMVFICYNTIKLSIFNRRDELEILWLVGATKHYIKAPLIWEGALIGGAAGLLSTTILWLGQYLAADFITTLLARWIPAFSCLLFTNMLWPLLLTGGALIATIGTILGCRKIIGP